MKTRNIIIGVLKIVFFLLVLVLLFFSILSCKSRVPHNLHKEPSERRGMINTPSGLIHKSVLKDIKHWRKKYKKVKK